MASPGESAEEEDYTSAAIYRLCLRQFPNLSVAA